jgi:hypothetical protein
MSRFVALYQNFADAGVLSGGSWLPELPLSNAQTRPIGHVARSNGLTSPATQFVVDIGVNLPIGGVVVGPTNISPGAQYRIRGSTSSSFSTTVVDTGLLTTPGGSGIDWSNPDAWLAWEDPGFWYGVPNAFDAALASTWLILSLPSDVSARYWKVEVVDALNRDGYFEFGRLLIGRMFRPSIGYAKGASFEVQPLYQRVEAIGGQRTDWDLNRRRGLRVSFDKLSHSELFDDVFRIQEICGATGQIFVIPDPADTTNLTKRSFLATMKAAPPIVQAFYNGGTTAFDFEEILR